MPDRMGADEYQRQFGRNPKLPLPTVVNGRPVRGATGGIVKAAQEGRLKPAKVPLPTEKQLQASIVKTLRVVGYNVDDTSQRRASGVSLGIADLLVNRDRWGPVWLQVEVKRFATSKRTPEQADRERRGIIIVVWTVQMAIQALGEWDRRLGK